MATIQEIIPRVETLEERLLNMYGFTPRTDQIKAIRTLVTKKKDLILIARTGFGKSLVFQSIPVLCDGIGIIIMPLNVIEEEQAAVVANLPGCNPIVLNGQTNTIALRKRIQTGQYSHIFLGPEIALSEEFRVILQDQSFQKKLVLVAIDELHVVHHWATWRTAYTKLAVLRSRINRDVPWFGTSATLDSETLNAVKSSAGFDEWTEIQRTTIDRPEIMWEIRPMQYATGSFQDLDFLLDPAKPDVVPASDVLRDSLLDNMERSSQEEFRGMVRRGDLASARMLLRGEDMLSIINRQNAERARRAEEVQRRQIILGIGNSSVADRERCFKIPKTIVYIDSIRQIELAERSLIAQLVRMGISRRASRLAIESYHSEVADFDKRAIWREFAKPDGRNFLNSSRHRIIIATDAMGMGIDNPDIARVVQYRLPDNMCSLLQRAGRAARAPRISGQFIWLVEHWCIGPTAEHFARYPTSQPSLSSSLAVEQAADSDGSTSSLYSESARQGRGKMARTEAERRSKLPNGFWLLINKPSCIRVSVLEYFSEDLSHYTKPSGNCCSRCNGSEVRPRVIHNMKYRQSPAQLTRTVANALMEWRGANAPLLFAGYMLSEPDILMPDAVVRTISRAACSITDIESLADIVSSQWAFLMLFGDEVIQVIKACEADIDLTRIQPRRRPRTPRTPRTTRTPRTPRTPRQPLVDTSGNSADQTIDASIPASKKAKYN